ncbi:glycosyltransferase family 2 protein [Pleomorphovibrio marinus]|uniref:glycosyltransferase family 2 protein n=1 Tax=Pleomorphovibrio marinus TaxID=2164132 RepID=UPI000E0C8D67|nr:glycosyltransferase family 2 protein [Pleomorphovibrio marinus]
MEKAAIVILNYNGEKILKRFFPSIHTLSNYPIVLIDNNSTDGSIRFISDNFTKVQIIRLERNLGYSGGYTSGLELVKGKYEYYILLNSDIAVTPYWDHSLVSQMETWNATAAQPKILSLNEDGFFDYAGASGGYLDLLGYPFCRGRILHTLEKDLGQYDDPVEVDWASGACFCVRTEDFHSAGGFDSHFFAHMEEIDLCIRLRKEGKKIFSFPTVVVYHLGGGTLHKSNPYKTYLNFRNSLYMLRKNLANWDFLKVFLMRIVWDTAAAFHVTLTQGLPHGMAIVKAYLHFLLRKNNLPTTSKTKKRNITVLKNPVHSIIYKYYVEGIKTFSGTR